MIYVYRVQGADGRGPWKPGLSKYWCEEGAHIGPLSETVMDLCGGFDAIRKLPKGWHYGCACRSAEGIAAWFTPTEAIRLSAMGYFPVKVTADRIFAESDKQLLVGRKELFNVGAEILSWADIINGVYV